MASSSEPSPNVRVAVRVRPLIGREAAERDSICISVPEADIPCVRIGSGADGKMFAFDAVFTPSSSQANVFDTCVHPLVESFLKGYNSTILAYGQTGSGKTFTVGTGSELLHSTGARGADDELGIIPRVARMLFERVAEARARQASAEFEVRVTFLEIYGDEIHDLLNMGGATKPLAIRDTEHGIGVSGAVERACEGATDMLGALEEGSLCRTTGSTAMNAHSSRSHAIFTIMLDQRIPYSVEDGDLAAAAAAGGASAAPDALEHRLSKFHILDLAGSERAKRTQATGKRLQEGININLGLLALGNVISALSDDDKRRRGAHVPYRDSKLTRILQDSLGGNSQTCMIACVSPAEVNFEESLNTLRYAARARNIRNTPVINRDANASQIAQLKAEIEALRAQLLGAAGDAPLPSTALGSPSLIGAGVSINALLEATGARDLSQVIDRLTSMRSASEEAEMLRARCAACDDEVARLTQELKRARLAVDAASEARIDVEVKLALLEDASSGGGSASVDADKLDAITRLTRRVHELESQLYVAQEAARSAYQSPSMRRPHSSPAMKTPRAHASLTPIAASTAELEAALQSVDPRLLVGADDDDLDDAGHAHAGDEHYPGSASFQRIMNRLDVDDDAVDGADGDGDMTAAPLEPVDEDAELRSVRRDFENRQKAMTKHVQDLDGNITVKQRYVLALEEKASRLDTMKRIYDGKLREMEKEMMAVQREREQLLLELQQAEHMVEEERLKATTAIRGKLEEADKRVKMYQERVRNLENVSRMQSRAAAEIRRLQADINELRRARVAQVAMMRTEKQRFMEEVTDRKRQMAALQKEGAALKSELARVRAEGEKREAVLRRKVEEAAAATQRRMRDASAAGSSPGVAADVTGSPLPADRHRAQQVAVAAVARSVRATRRGGKGGRASVSAGAAAAAAAGEAAARGSDAAEQLTTVLRHQLESAVARIAEKERRVEELERRLHAREADVRMLEELMEQRNALRFGDMDESSLPAAPVHGALVSGGQADTDIDATLLDDIDAFFDSHVDASATRPSTAAADHPPPAPAVLPRHARQLTDEETEALAALEEQIELAQTRLGYQDERILTLARADDELAREIAAAVPMLQTATDPTPAALHSTTEGTPQHGDLLASLGSISSLAEAHTALKLLFSMVVELKREERHRGTRAAELQVKVTEQQAALDAADASIKALRLEHERRLMDSKREQAAEMDTLLRLAASTISGVMVSEAPAAPAPIAPAATAAASPDVLSLASPSELMNMLKATRERMQELQEEVTTQGVTIADLQRERERLRAEINRLSMTALRKQEQQHRRSSREAMRQHVPPTHTGPPGGKASMGASATVATTAAVSSSKHAFASTADAHAGLHVQGSGLTAAAAVVYGGPPHSAPSVVAAIASANQTSAAVSATRSSSRLTSPTASSAGATDDEVVHATVGEDGVTRHSHEDVVEAGNKARAWWSERGIVPVSVAVPPSAPAGGHAAAANVRVVVAPPSIPVKPLLRATSRNGVTTDAAPPALLEAAPPPGVKPPSARTTASTGVTHHKRHRSGGATAAVPAVLADEPAREAASGEAGTDTGSGGGGDATVRAASRQSVSSRYLSALQQQAAPPALSRAGSMPSGGSSVRTSGFSEPMQVRTSIPDIMSPPKTAEE